MVLSWFSGNGENFLYQPTNQKADSSIKSKGGILRSALEMGNYLMRK